MKNMKVQSKSRKSPTCSRCRFHGDRDVRVLQHKCPYKDCTCSDCLLVKKRSVIYRAQKNLDKQDENSNEVSSPGSGSTGSSRCLGSPQIPMHPGNMGDSNEPSLQNPWSTNHQPPPPPPQQLSQQLQQQHQAHQQPPQVPPPPSSLAPPPPPHQMPPSIATNKNSGYSNIKNFQTLCLTFPDHPPPQLQTLFEQCGNDYEKTIDKILMSKWYSETPSSSNDYQPLTNDPNYSNNHNSNNNNSNNLNNNNMNHNNNNINNTNSNTTNNNSSNHNHHHNHNLNTNHNNNTNSNNNHNNLDYPTNEDDTRLSFANCHYNQQPPPPPPLPQQQPQQQQQPPQPQQPQAPSQRMMTAPNFNNQDYTGDELVNRSIQPHNSDAMAPDWSSYGDTSRYSTATSNYSNNNNNNNNNTWNQGDYPAWSNASSNFWPSNGHTSYSYVDQNDANAMSYYYGRREMDYQESSGHLDRTVRPEVGPNISSNYDFDSY